MSDNEQVRYADIEKELQDDSVRGELRNPSGFQAQEVIRFAKTIARKHFPDARLSSVFLVPAVPNGRDPIPEQMVMKIGMPPQKLPDDAQMGAFVKDLLPLMGSKGSADLETEVTPHPTWRGKAIEDEGLVFARLWNLSPEELYRNLLDSHKGQGRAKA
ncbi:MAG TPA: hypothetical protein VFB14_24035 [Bryobacteraceae bacterium]|nr:hypothetical protein [Bryobacteraceae bacterium]